MAKKVKEPKVKGLKAKKVGEPQANSAALLADGKKTGIIGNPVRVLALAAIVSALLGIALFQFYDDYKSYIDYIVGGVVALVGLASILFYFFKRMVSGVYRNEFAIGVVCIALGVYIAMKGGASFSFLVIVGILCALDGVIKLQYTLDLARMRFKTWWLALIFSLLGLAIGVVILMDLLEDVAGAQKVSMTGIALCANAVFDLVVLITVAVRNRKAAKAAAAAELAPAAPAPAVEEKPFEVVVYEDSEPYQPELEAAEPEAPAEEPAPEPVPEPEPEPEKVMPDPEPAVPAGVDEF